MNDEINHYAAGYKEAMRTVEELIDRLKEGDNGYDEVRTSRLRILKEIEDELGFIKEADDETR